MFYIFLVIIVSNFGLISLSHWEGYLYVIHKLVKEKILLGGYW